MNTTVERLFKKLPPCWGPVQTILVKNGLRATLVGGTVRDFILTGDVGKDWDVEISSDTLPFNPDLWKSLRKELSTLGRVLLLPYDVIRLYLDGYEFEFSPQRLETFDEQDKSHKNFTAELHFDLPFLKAAQRRDFTINALGIDLMEKVLQDPFDGERHLREKFLVDCGDHFSKDPVRFLRALRFSLKLDLVITPELRSKMDSMNLSEVSAHYLWSEMQKSKDPLAFYLLVEKEKHLHPELVLPLSQELGPKKEELKKFLFNPGSHEDWIIALSYLGYSTEEWVSYFRLSPEVGKRLASWAQLSKDLEALEVERFQRSFEEVLQDSEFQKIFDWYFSTKQIQQKSPQASTYAYLKEILPVWGHLFTFDPVKDVKHIDPPLRAKYQVWNLCQRI